MNTWLLSLGHAPAIEIPAVKAKPHEGFMRRDDPVDTARKARNAMAFASEELIGRGVTKPGVAFKILKERGVVPDGYNEHAFRNNFYRTYKKVKCVDHKPRKSVIAARMYREGKTVQEIQAVVKSNRPDVVAMLRRHGLTKRNGENW